MRTDVLKKGTQGLIDIREAPMGTARNSDTRKAACICEKAIVLHIFQLSMLVMLEGCIANLIGYLLSAGNTSAIMTNDIELIVFAPPPINCHPPVNHKARRGKISGNHTVASVSISHTFIRIVSSKQQADLIFSSLTDRSNPRITEPALQNRKKQDTFTSNAIGKRTIWKREQDASNIQRISFRVNSKRDEHENLPGILSKESFHPLMSAISL
jgi:hypothetical protein